MDFYFDNLFTPVFGLVWIIVGIYRWRKSTNLISNGIRTTGIVSDFVDSSSTENLSVSPVVSFKTVESGRQITQKLDFSTDPPIHKLGQRIRLIYDPQDPTNVSIDSSFLHVWVPRLMVALGMAIFIYGAYQYYINNF